MRLIDADTLKKPLEALACGKAKNQSYRDGLNDGLHDFFPQIIDSAPTVDAVPVVRCAKCKFSKSRLFLSGEDRLLCENSECPCFCRFTSDGWGCLAGERREAEHGDT